MPLSERPARPLSNRAPGAASPESMALDAARRSPQTQQTEAKRPTISALTQRALKASVGQWSE